jgi:hypothetical protein
MDAGKDLDQIILKPFNCLGKAGGVELSSYKYWLEIILMKLPVPSSWIRIIGT